MNPNSSFRPVGREGRNNLPEPHPKPPKLGYWTTPDFSEIAKLSPEEVRRVEDFTIENQFGRIVFQGETDLSGVDLAEVVTIKKGEAEVYEDNYPNKPKLGMKLNKAAIITLYDIQPKNQ